MADKPFGQKFFDNLLKWIVLGATSCVIIVGAVQIYPVQFGLVAAVAALIGLAIWQHRRAEDLRARNRDLQRDLDRARRW